MAGSTGERVSGLRDVAGTVLKPATARANGPRGSLGGAPNRALMALASVGPEAADPKAVVVLARVTLALPPLATTVTPATRPRDDVTGNTRASAVLSAWACGSRETSQTARVHGRKETDGTGTNTSRSTIRSTKTSTGTLMRTSRGTICTSTRGTPASASACSALNSGSSRARNVNRRMWAAWRVRAEAGRAGLAASWVPIGCFLARRPDTIRGTDRRVSVYRDHHGAAVQPAPLRTAANVRMPLQRWHDAESDGFRARVA